MIFNGQYSKPNIKEVNSNFLENLRHIVYGYFSDKYLFNESNVSIYFCDEYCYNTACYSNIPATVYIEINQPDNYKTLRGGQPYQFDHNNLKAPHMYLTLQTLKKNLLDEMLKVFDSTCTLWQFKYGIMLSTFAEDEEGNRTYYSFRIIPCITYINKDGKRGIMYYNDYLSEINIEYPKLSIINFRIKDRQTSGLLAEFTSSLKLQYMKLAKTPDLPDTIFETMAYNVPVELLSSDNMQTYYKAVNYLRKLNLREYKAIDEIDNAFTCKYRIMSATYVNHVLKVIGKNIPNN